MLSLQSAASSLPPLNGANDRERAIVSTLLYYDLFSFPLSAAETVRYLHCIGADAHLSPPDLLSESAWWSSHGGYWFLRGREEIISQRDAVARHSNPKLASARRWACWLQWLPGVRFIGVTGSLAMRGAVAEDDIDLLVITASGQLWLTRALVLGALWVMGVKRSDNSRVEHPDQACANVFLSEADLTLPDHNLFIAHEVCQMLPLAGPSAYERFLEANEWVREYLPQWEPAAPHWEDRRALRLIQRVLEIVAHPLRDRLERAVAQRQMERIRRKHARGHNPQVVITPTQLRFNPQDHGREILRAYEARWSALNGGELRGGGQESGLAGQCR